VLPNFCVYMCVYMCVSVCVELFGKCLVKISRAHIEQLKTGVTGIKYTPGVLASVTSAKLGTILSPKSHLKAA